MVLNAGIMVLCNNVHVHVSGLCFKGPLELCDRMRLHCIFDGKAAHNEGLWLDS